LEEGFARLKLQAVENLAWPEIENTGRRLFQCDDFILPTYSPATRRNLMVLIAVMISIGSIHMQVLYGGDLSEFPSDE
jgi:hypothetical protein